MKLIRGTQDAKGNVFTKTPDGGTGRMRCMKCQGLVVATRMADGKQVMQCQSCGANHTTASMDKPYTPPPGTVPTLKRP